MVEQLVSALEAVSRVLLPIHMTFAERDMVEDPISDDAVIFSFMGSGCSDRVTAKEFREAAKLVTDALALAKERSK